MRHSAFTHKMINEWTKKTCSCTLYHENAKWMWNVQIKILHTDCNTILDNKSGKKFLQDNLKVLGWIKAESQLLIEELKHGHLSPHLRRQSSISSPWAALLCYMLLLRSFYTLCLICQTCLAPRDTDNKLVSHCCCCCCGRHDICST